MVVLDYRKRLFLENIEVTLHKIHSGTGIENPKIVLAGTKYYLLSRTAHTRTILPIL